MAPAAAPRTAESARSSAGVEPWARWEAEARGVPSGATRMQAALGCGWVRPAEAPERAAAAVRCCRSESGVKWVHLRGGKGVGHLRWEGVMGYGVSVRPAEEAERAAA